MFCSHYKVFRYHKLTVRNIQAINSLPYRSPFASKSRRRRVWNPQLVAEWNCDAVAYVIKPQWDAYTRLRVMPYALGDSIQCASALIPCQACGLDKKKTSEQVRMFSFLVSQLQTKSNLIYTLSTALLSLSITLLNSNTTNNIKKLQLKNWLACFALFKHMS